MNVLLRNVTIVQPGYDLNMQQTDVLMRNGIIERIGTFANDVKLTEDIDASELFLSPGWLDFQANLCDPGFEYKEDLITGLNTAAAGGFTGVMTLPNTQPCVDSKAQVEYVLQKAKNHLVDVFPCASITASAEGKQLSEMMDLHAAGAVAFTDGESSVHDAGVLTRALQYIKPFDGLIINRPDDKSLSKGGMMNESAASVMLGLKPMPALAEELMVMRDIALAEYTGCKIMIGPVSTARGVALVRDARRRDVYVQCFVHAHHLLLDDTSLESFDANHKVNPPLRTLHDVKALRDALLDETVDIVASGHQPQNEELKKVEFDYAAFGMIGLQTAFACTVTAMGTALSAEQCINLFSINPRRAIRQSIPVIAEGKPLNATLFSMELEWEYNLAVNQSKSQNSPLLGRTLKGKPVAVFNNHQFTYC